MTFRSHQYISYPCPRKHFHDSQKEQQLDCFVFLLRMQNKKITSDNPHPCLSSFSLISGVVLHSRISRSRFKCFQLSIHLWLQGNWLKSGFFSDPYKATKRRPWRWLSHVQICQQKHLVLSLPQLKIWFSPFLAFCVLTGHNLNNMVSVGLGRNHTNKTLWNGNMQDSNKHARSGTLGKFVADVLLASARRILGCLGANGFPETHSHMCTKTFLKKTLSLQNVNLMHEQKGLSDDTLRVCKVLLHQLISIHFPNCPGRIPHGLSEAVDKQLLSVNCLREQNPFLVNCGPDPVQFSTCLDYRWVNLLMYIAHQWIIAISPWFVGRTLLPGSHLISERLPRCIDRAYPHSDIASKRPH